MVDMGDVDKAEEDWNRARMGGRDLEDLRRASKEIMRGYNQHERWLDTIKLFKWNLDASKLERRGRRTFSDVMKIKDIGKFLAAVDLRGKIQEEEKNIRGQLASRLETSVNPPRPIVETSKEQPADDSIDEYIEFLRDTLLRLQKVPEVLQERAGTAELEKMLGEVIASQSSVQDEMTGIDGKLLELCFCALLSRGDSKRLLILYHEYHHRVKFTSQTWEYVIAAYLNLGKIKKAQGVLRYAVFRRQYLPKKCFTTILDAIRNTGGSWDKIVRYFVWLERLTGGREETLYHIMAQTAIARGMQHEAATYLKQMTDKGHQITAKTIGDMLSAHAMARDWVGLRQTLAIFDEHGLKIPTGSFNAVLNAYADCKFFHDTEMFYKFGLERGIVPNLHTYTIMLKATVYDKGAANAEHLAYWLDQILENGFKLNEYSFSALFQDLRHNYKASAALLRRVYQKILRFHTKSKLLGDSAKGMLLKTSHHESRMYPFTYKQLRLDKTNYADKLAVALRMSSALEAQHPEDALDLWQKAITHGTIPSIHMILLAQQGWDIPQAMVLLVRDSVQKLNKHNLSNLEDVDEVFATADENLPKLDIIYASAEEVYQFLDRNKLPVTHHSTVHNANRLINAGDHYAAIHLMHKVALTKWGKATPYDIIGLCVILKAYCRARDLSGIKWTAEQVIARRLRPTPVFFKYLHQLLRAFDELGIVKEKRLVEIVIYELKQHMAVMEVEARIKAQFMVDFIKGAVGIRPARRYGANYPLVTDDVPAEVTNEGQPDSMEWWNEYSEQSSSASRNVSVHSTIEEQHFPHIISSDSQSLRKMDTRRDNMRG
ncbi:hypothetical protein BDZ91DRAFT_779033 [Kalaharituber pfeilii]|nr:hypothetical protein BDZ91DRAFT_779033 [Kalaharituber pfeilii]